MKVLTRILLAPAYVLAIILALPLTLVIAIDFVIEGQGSKTA